MSTSPRRLRRRSGADAIIATIVKGVKRGRGYARAMTVDWRAFVRDPFELRSVDETSARAFRAKDIEEVFFEDEGGNQFDGRGFSLVRLADGRFAAIVWGYSNLAPPWLDSVSVGASADAAAGAFPDWIRARFDAK